MAEGATARGASPPRRKLDRAATSSVLARLRAVVLSGAIAPGTVLSQVQLARDLGVSTTPLREAIRLLQAEGLLTSERNRRVRVAPLDLEDLDAVYSGRILQEAIGLTLTVPRLTDAELAELRERLDAMRAAGAAEDLDAWEVEHTAFHRLLVAHVGLSQGQLIASLFDRAERYRRISVLGSSPRAWHAADAEHERIVEACERRDATAAVHELARHLGRTALMLAAHSAPERDPAAVRAAVGLVTSWGSADAPAADRR
jgi:DNA-binding GntR family transcriptional regulator